MTVYLLIRHGDNDSVGRYISGRMPGVHLNAKGRQQAEALAERLSRLPLDAVFSSPMERTRETAAPLAERLGQPVQIRDDLNEIDFGQWTGRLFQELEQDPRWRQYNLFRGGTRIPGGEMFTEVQARMVREADHIRYRMPEGLVALVGHADPLKSLIAAFAGIPLENMLRFDISPASVSMLSIDDQGARILGLNHTGDWLAA